MRGMLCNDVARTQTAQQDLHSIQMAQSGRCRAGAERPERLDYAAGTAHACHSQLRRHLPSVPDRARQHVDSADTADAHARDASETIHSRRCRNRFH